MRRKKASDSAISSIPFMPSSMLTQPLIVMLGKYPEDGVVIVESLAGHTVAEVGRIAQRAVGLTEVVECRPRGQRSVAGVHADDPRRDGSQ